MAAPMESTKHAQRVFSCLSGSESQKRRNHGYHPTPMTWCLVVVVSLICVQTCRLLFRGYDADAAIQASSMGAAYAPSEGVAFLSARGYRQRILEAQLQEKDQELLFLRKQLESMVSTSRVKDDSMQAAEVMIKTLQEREQAEKVARSKALLALSERVSALQACQHQKASLIQEVDRCGESLNAVLAAEEGHYR